MHDTSQPGDPPSGRVLRTSCRCYSALRRYGSSPAAGPAASPPFLTLTPVNEQGRADYRRPDNDGKGNSSPVPAESCMGPTLQRPPTRTHQRTLSDRRAWMVMGPKGGGLRPAGYVPAVETWGVPRTFAQSSLVGQDLRRTALAQQLRFRSPSLDSQGLLASWTSRTGEFRMAFRCGCAPPPGLPGLSSIFAACEDHKSHGIMLYATNDSRSLDTKLAGRASRSCSSGLSAPYSVDSHGILFGPRDEHWQTRDTTRSRTHYSTQTVTLLIHQPTSPPAHQPSQTQFPGSL